MKSKVIAAFLSLLFFLQIVAPVVYAAETAGEVLTLIPDNQPSESEFMEPELPSEELEKAHILMEDPEKREEKVKTFWMSDGSYLAAMYPDPVHYQTEDGEWQEIDNRLEEVPVQEDEFFAQEGEDEGVSEEHSETNSQPEQEATSAPEQKPGSSEADGSSQTVSKATEESTISSEISSESVSSEVVSSQTESQPDDSLGNESTPVKTVPEAEEEETQTVSQVLSAKSMEKADADDSTELQNKANTTKIKLSNKLKSGKTVTVQTEEGKIRWGLDGAKKLSIKS